MYAQLLSLLGSAASALTIVAAVQIDLMTGSSSWEDSADLARKLEGAGFGGMLYTETTQVPWMQIAAASMAAPSLFFTTGIAVAFPRSPMLSAAMAYEIVANTGGRFRLGLGSQVKAHIERRYSADFDRPAARMRDYVESVKAAWRAFNREERLDHHGEFYEMTLLPPDWAPRRHDHEMKVDISAVGPMMTKVAAQVADGVHVHPLHSMAYLEHRLLPISPPAPRGRARSERGRADRAGLRMPGRYPGGTGSRCRHAAGRSRSTAPPPTMRSSSMTSGSRARPAASGPSSKQASSTRSVM